MKTEKMARLGVYTAGVGMLLLTAAGCASKPKLAERTGMLPPPSVHAVEPMPTVRPGGADWEAMNAPLRGGGTGNIVPANKRWADVVVYFAYDSSAVGPAERPKLEVLSQHLKQHPEYAVVIEGHCDERGSEEYNRALGESRAISVRDYLISLGISSTRLETVSYGEERPVIPDATTEAEYQKNRRAEFIIGTRR